MVTPERRLPRDPLAFIQDCVRGRRVLWSYHVNMRLAGRHISREEVLDAVDRYEVIESYPQDKYLPSYLLLARPPGSVFHVLFGTDVEGNNVRLVTAYRPDANEWERDLRTRRKPR